MNFEQRKEYLEKIFEEYSLLAGTNLTREELDELIETFNLNEEKNLRKLKQRARKVFFGLKSKEVEKV